jgi:hypothetical protein
VTIKVRWHIAHAPHSSSFTNLTGIGKGREGVYLRKLQAMGSSRTAQTCQRAPCTTSYRALTWMQANFCSHDVLP